MLKLDYRAITAAALIGGGGLLFFLPVSNDEIRPYVPNMGRATEPAPEPAVLDRLSTFFDSGNILIPVDIKVVEEPGDPAEQQLRYLGMASSEARQVALFEDNGEIKKVHKGDSIGGLVLQAFNGQGAVFTNPDQSAVELRLGPTQ